MKGWICATALAVCLLPGAASAEVKVGVILSTTGPGAGAGVPEARAIPLLPTSIAGEAIRYIVLDDRSDTTTAVQSAKKLFLDDKVDVVIGPTLSAPTLAIVDLATQARVPVVTLAGSSITVEPVEQRRWIFKVPQNDSMLVSAIANHMAKSGIKTVSVIVTNDSYGQGWLDVFNREASRLNITVTAAERYARTDTSVSGQVLKLIAPRPDAIFVASGGTPAALPQMTVRDRGYKGPIYQTHGVVMDEFVRVGGTRVEGTLAPAGPVVVAEELPDSHPSKAAGLAYWQRYDRLADKDPGRSNFGAYVWDAGLLLANALDRVLPKQRPGTDEFRTALRDAIEETHDLVTTNGVVSMSKTDHVGLDNRSYVLVQIRNGRWTLVQ